MAATSFFGLGYALSTGSHIRVELILNGMKGDRRLAEILCTSVSVFIVAMFAWFAVKANYVSWVLGERSQGQDEIPIWIPQIAMSVGAVILLIALLDRLMKVVRSTQFLEDKKTTTIAG